MIKLRLNGTLEEMKEIIEQLEISFNVLNTSEPYKDRGKNNYYRYYLDIEPKKKKQEVVKNESNN